MAENKKTRDRLQELRETNDADLTVIVANAHKNIYLFRKDRLGKPVADVKVVKYNRKEIARALTIQRERELAQSKEG